MITGKPKKKTTKVKFTEENHHCTDAEINQNFKILFPVQIL